MELIDNLLLGLQVSLTWGNLGYCLLGVAVGTLIGVLPGVGPVMTIALLLPITFGLPPAAALIMLAGIYYGAQYGGSTTAILLNVPGETSAVVTCLDGHKMARQGRAGVALGIAAIGSFIGGTVATLLIALFSPTLSAVGLSFGPTEYFSLMVVGLVAAVVLAHGSLRKAIAMTVLGLLLGLVGMDINSSFSRFSFGVPQLMDGIDFVVVATGLFGFAEILHSLSSRRDRQITTTQVGSIWPTRDDLRASAKPIMRGTLLGSLLGVLPGGGAAISSFAAYSLEKKLSRHPERFGQGAIEGVAGPETANNAAAQTSFIPLLTLGLPSNPVMALMIGAMMIHGISPGPQVATQNPDLFWGIIVSMWVGNLLLVILNLPMVGLWVRLLHVPYRLLYPAILLLGALGVYSLNFSTVDVMLATGFGLLGFVLLRLGCEPAPLLLGLVLGPLMEENLRRAMLLARGDATVFVTNPVSLALLLLACTLIALVLLPAFRRTRAVAFQE